MKVCIFQHKHPRSRKLAVAFAQGAARMGWQFEHTTELHIVPRADLLLAYGWLNREMFEAYHRAGLHYVYADLGYWARKRDRNDYGGHHKLVVNGRHATGYFQRHPRPGDRLQLAPPLQPWRSGGQNVIIAGLSAKGAIGHGMRPMAWENEVIAKLRKLTDRPLVYRPKPSWKDARPIQGTIFSPGDKPIEAELAEAHALVTVSSNAALDALAAGVPVHALEGLASVMSTPLEQIEQPLRPEGRKQWLQDVSYCHWTRAEVASGTPLAMFRDEGLLG